MACQSIWYFTNIPTEVVDIIENNLSEKYQNEMSNSFLAGNVLDKNKRSSKNTWIPTTEWMSGFIWHYVQRANRENFLYDLNFIDGETIQFTKYDVGEYYGWHCDASLPSFYKPISVGNSTQNLVGDFLSTNTEMVRKLSFVLQLSDPDDYEGGNLQLLDENGKSYFAPRQKGTMILFDSRTQHRVLKVTKGTRKSLVGWVVGPRWK